MSKSTRYLESSATPEEDSYSYRVEWDHQTNTAKDMVFGEPYTDYGAGSRDVCGFDNAWDVYNDLLESPWYRGVRLIQIDSDGNERIYAED